MRLLSSLIASIRRGSLYHLRRGPYYRKICYEVTQVLSSNGAGLNRLDFRATDTFYEKVREGECAYAVDKDVTFIWMGILISRFGGPRCMYSCKIKYRREDFSFFQSQTKSNENVKSIRFHCFLSLLLSTTLVRRITFSSLHFVPLSTILAALVRIPSPSSLHLEYEVM